MAYVPKYEHDVFISYAHGDNRDWIGRFVDRLSNVTRVSLGGEAKFWIDEGDLRRTRDFSMEIPDNLKSSATMMLFPSPTYIRSRYCVEQECRLYTESLIEKQRRFDTPSFRNDLFVFRCPILPIDDNRHWNLFRGVTDYKFHDRSRTLEQGSADFEIAFRRLSDDLLELLKRMRNRSTPVFLHPLGVPLDIKTARDVLAAELSAQSYRVLPDDYLDPLKDLSASAMSVFLLGGDQFDEEDTVADELERTSDLIDAARQQPKPWVVWRSPTAAMSTSPMRRGYHKRFEHIDSEYKTYLNEKITITNLKEQVLAILGVNGRVASSDGKKRVYVVFDPSSEDIANAGMIQSYFRKSYHFEFSKDPRQHSKWLSQSDGVLLVWGDSGEDWCSYQFEEMQRLARSAKSRGICLFEPKESKKTALRLIRNQAADVCISEQFGPTFDPFLLSPFFEKLQ